MSTNLINEENVSRETLLDNLINEVDEQIKKNNEMLENLNKKEKPLKKEREPSKSYTLKSFTENIKKFSKFGWITENENNELNTILKNCISKYTQEKYGHL